ncbi:DUF6457 domain-containing protein [Actinophytocola oryzae]|uniref:DUF6457 domain-containing protein n=1 Tax=Actinophytocola oryzae TaxID=502181 RepID=A0A4R7VUZ7_9PSEU|nr:DUF6457 domain-containing protein [Actinophytocola oryzae]TDV53820.1 hypothetical protein CLV71_104288 [Actinophytocola oryzae]
MDGLAEWLRAASARLGIDAGQVDSAEIIRLARDVRRAESGPAAFMAVYLLGVAVGRGADPHDAAAHLADLIEERSGTTCDWRD